MTDDDLYVRGMATLVASWEEYARASRGALLRRHGGATIAVFPNEPERAVYNNALLERSLAAIERVDALEGMEAAYEAAGITSFAAWVHESDDAMQHDLESRGYVLSEATRAMALAFDETVPRVPTVELGPSDWSEYLRIIRVPPDFLSASDHHRYHIRIARFDGANVAAAMSFDFRGDCGIYNVGTLEHARRRGLATALIVLHLNDARARGCRSASLQSTRLAEHMYAAIGFRDLGLIHEYRPQ